MWSCKKMVTGKYWRLHLRISSVTLGTNPRFGHSFFLLLFYSYPVLSCNKVREIYTASVVLIATVHCFVFLINGYLARSFDDGSFPHRPMSTVERDRCLQLHIAFVIRERFSRFLVLTVSLAFHCYVLAFRFLRDRGITSLQHCNNFNFHESALFACFKQTLFLSTVN